jgi:hypothetical protein
LCGAADDILEAMEKHGVGGGEGAEILVIAYAMKGDIDHR